MARRRRNKAWKDLELFAAEERGRSNPRRQISGPEEPKKNKYSRPPKSPIDRQIAQDQKKYAAEDKAHKVKQSELLSRQLKIAKKFSPEFVGGSSSEYTCRFTTAGQQAFMGTWDGKAAMGPGLKPMGPVKAYELLEGQALKKIQQARAKGERASAQKDVEKSINQFKTAAPKEPQPSQQAGTTDKAPSTQAGPSKNSPSPKAVSDERKKLMRDLKQFNQEEKARMPKKLRHQIMERSYLGGIG